MNAALKHIGNSLIKRLPSILTGVGISGFGTAIVMGIKAAPTYYALRTTIDQDDKKEQTKLIFKVFWPTMTVAVCSAGCIIFSDSIDFRRERVLATACAVSERALSDQQTKIIETLGEKENEKIKHLIHKDKVESKDFKDHDNDGEYINRGHGNVKFIEAQCNQKFMADAEFIRQAINEFNARLLEEGECSLNELYDELDLPNTESGYILGWKCESRNDLISVHFDSILMDDKTSRTIIDFSPHPNYDYRR